MKKLIGIFAASTVAVMLNVGIVHALGTKAGTTINNSAQADYTVGGKVYSKPAVAPTITVAQLSNFNLIWNDSAPIAVISPSTGQTTSFKLTNLGNGPEKYLISSQAAVGFDWDPNTPDYWIDSAIVPTGDGKQSLGDQHQNYVTLQPDQSIIVFVNDNIPTAGGGGALADATKGGVLVTATSDYGTGGIGTVKTGAGIGTGVDVVLATGGTAQATGQYIVAGITLNMTKTSTCSNSYTGAAATLCTPSATVTYTMDLWTTGSSTATAAGVVVSDIIPAGTTYKANGLYLGTKKLTEAAGDDEGDYNITTAGKVTVNVGDMKVADGHKTVSFQVVINNTGATP